MMVLQQNVSGPEPDSLPTRGGRTVVVATVARSGAQIARCTGVRREADYFVCFQQSNNRRAWSSAITTIFAYGTHEHILKHNSCALQSCQICSRAACDNIIS